MNYISDELQIQVEYGFRWNTDSGGILSLPDTGVDWTFFTLYRTSDGYDFMKP